MNILLLGSGGREHALAWKISQSPLLKKLYIAPGNPGTQKLGENLNVSLSNFQQIKKAVKDFDITMVIVGPEDPLVNGIHDFFLSDNELKNIPVIGPTKKGAMLEGSKDFSKGFMLRHGIPTARYKSFKANQKPDAEQFLSTLNPPYVLKADGLAAGKGVIICQSLTEAQESLNTFFDGTFGEAGSKVVIEEFLHGIEVSVFALTDGKSYVLLPEAKDYKRVGVGDTGPNTGGMGAISPVPFFNSTFRQKVEERIIQPTIKGLISEGIDYRGFIFAGLMNVNGEPYVIEYNARMGDPETQVVMPRLKTDLLELFQLAAKQELHKAKIEYFDRTAAAVILVSGGYPSSYTKGFEITGIDNSDNAITFHAGTCTNQNGRLSTSGGRVLASVGIESNIAKALSIAYDNAETIDFKEKYYRIDIGKDLI
jgi:phosphoribosylamine--glycine ligase